MANICLICLCWILNFIHCTAVILRHQGEKDTLGTTHLSTVQQSKGHPYITEWYTAKLLFHQSPTLHSDYTVTGQWWCSHHWQLPAARWQHRWSPVWSPCCWQFTMVTTPSLSSHRVITVQRRQVTDRQNKSLAVYLLFHCTLDVWIWPKLHFAPQALSSKSHFKLELWEHGL